MKKLFFTLCCVLSTFLFFSCSSDGDNDDEDRQALVPTTTGAITHNGVNFNTETLIVTSVTIDKQKTKSTLKTSEMTLLFNDNVQVIITAEFPTDQKIPLDDAYYIYLKYGTKITFNLLEGNTIKITETFPKTVPFDTYLTSMNTLTLDFKNKHEYKGEIELPKEPEIEDPELIAPDDWMTIIERGAWECHSEGFIEKTNEPQYNPFYIRFRTIKDMIYADKPGDTKFKMQLTYIGDLNDMRFYFTDAHPRRQAHYQINYVTTSSISIIYLFFDDRGEIFNFDKEFIFNRAIY